MSLRGLDWVPRLWGFFSGDTGLERHSVPGDNLPDVGDLPKSSGREGAPALL